MLRIGYLWVLFLILSIGCSSNEASITFDADSPLACRAFCETVSCVENGCGGACGSCDRLAFDVEASASFSSEISSLIGNFSMEELGDDELPVGWSQESWGDNSPVFSIVSDDAADGVTAARVELTEWTSGDAKWIHEPVAVTPETEYVLGDRYRSNVYSQVVLRFTNASGEDSYLWLATLDATESWTQTEFTFFTPADVATMTVLHFINTVGWLETDLFVFKEVESLVFTGIIPNASFEQSPGGQTPLGWYPEAWGSNSPQFSYVNEGAEGSRSVRVEMTDWVSGDAKWTHDPVEIQGGETYSYSDSYRANVSTGVVLRIIMNDESVRYVGLPSAEAAEEWTTYGAVFTLPEDAAKVAVLHLIAADGWLQMDQVSLDVVNPLVTTDGIPNASLEQTVFGETPKAWYTENWGENEATFAYLDSGHTGEHSVEVVMDEYTSGDAKWTFEPVAVEGGQTYQFTDSYTSTVSTKVVLRLLDEDGVASYHGLKNAVASPDGWTTYQDVFTLPESTTHLSVLHLIDSVGRLVIDDLSLVAYVPEGFERGIVSLTFDDGWEDNYTTALPMMAEYGILSTQYYATTFIANSDETYKIDAFVEAGHEIGSHTVTHPFLSQIDVESMRQELLDSRTLLEGFYGEGNVKHFASPYGDYDETVLEQIADFYDTHRSTDEGYNSKDNLDLMNLRVQNVKNTTTSAEMIEWINRAYQDGTWLVIVLHRVDGDPGAYDTTPEVFGEAIAAIDELGVAVLPVKDALAEILPQMP